MHLAIDAKLDEVSPPQAGAAVRALSVVHVVLSLDVGGLERIVVALAREGRAIGQQVSVLCLERPGDLATEAEAAGARVVCVHKKPGLRPGLVGKAAAALRDLKPDVVHTHQVAALLYAGRAARRLGVPVVHTEHGKHYAARWKTRLLGRLASPAAGRFCCVSADIASEVIACGVAPPMKVVVVANGIDVPAFQVVGDKASARRDLGLPTDGVLIGTVGRFSDVKHQDLLIRAFAGLRATRSDVRLLVVGDGPKREELGRLAADLGVSGVVHFAGYQSRPERFLAAMDVFALTSKSEGMPLVVLEAWAAGLPVIASRVGGVPELINHRTTGLLFDSGDEKALTAGLLSLADDGELAARLGDAGRRKVETAFHVRGSTVCYQRHYLDVLPRPADDGGVGR